MSMWRNIEIAHANFFWAITAILFDPSRQPGLYAREGNMAPEKLSSINCKLSWVSTERDAGFLSATTQICPTCFNVNVRYSLQRKMKQCSIAIIIHISSSIWCFCYSPYWNEYAIGESYYRNADCVNYLQESRNMSPLASSSWFAEDTPNAFILGFQSMNTTPIVRFKYENHTKL
jgi:hypothetical protein